MGVTRSDTVHHRWWGGGGCGPRPADEETEVCVGGVSDFCEVTRWAGVQAHEMGALILGRSPSITLWVLQGKFTVILEDGPLVVSPLAMGPWDSGLWVQACEPRSLRRALGRLREPGSEDVGLAQGEGKQGA